MSRKKLKRGVGGSSPTVRYVGLTHWLLNSQAWKSMPEAACKLLIDVWKRHNGANNGEISYACREAEKIGISRPKAARMFDTLIERGFLVMVRESSFDRKKIARTWRITAEPSGDKPATKDFMSWRPDAPKTQAENFPSLTHETHSLTSETMSPDLARTVSPMRLSAPKTSSLQSHQRDTYSIPCSGGAAQPMGRLWKPSAFTRQRAREDLGMRHGETREFIRLFRDNHLQ